MYGGTSVRSYSVSICPLLREEYQSCACRTARRSAKQQLRRQLSYQIEHCQRRALRMEEKTQDGCGGLLRGENPEAFLNSGGQFSWSPFPLPEESETLAGKAFCAPRYPQGMFQGRRSVPKNVSRNECGTVESSELRKAICHHDDDSEMQWKPMLLLLLLVNWHQSSAVLTSKKSSGKHNTPGHLKAVILKLVGRMFLCSWANLPSQGWSLGCSVRRNRAIVIAESLARVIAAIRIASARWRSYLPQNTEISPHRPCVRCAAIRIAPLAFIRATFVPRGIAKNGLRVDRVR